MLGSDDQRIAMEHLAAGEPEIDIPEHDHPAADEEEYGYCGKIHHCQTAIHDPVGPDEECQQGEAENREEESFQNTYGLVSDRDEHIDPVEAKVLEQEGRCGSEEAEKDGLPLEWGTNKAEFAAESPSTKRNTNSKGRYYR